MRDTLAIVGSYTPTRKEFDFNRTDCDIWVFNEAVCVDWCTRADAVFQMHEKVIWSNPANRNDPNHVLWLKNISAPCNICHGSGKLQDKSDCPRCDRGVYKPPANRLDTTVYMLEQTDEIPNSKKYPLEGILEMAKDQNHFLTSSVPQAMALAAYLGIYKRVELYGIGMTTNTEYQYQREGVAHWYGYLKGMGIDVVFIGNVFEAPIYGYEGNVVIPYEKFGERIAELTPQIEQLTNEYVTARVEVEKAVSQLERDGSKENQDNVLKRAQALIDIGEKLGDLDGAKQENERYRNRADVMRKETGGEFIFSRQEFEGSAHGLKGKQAIADTEFVSVATTLGHIERNALQAAKGSPKRAKLFQLYRETMESYFRHQNRAVLFKGAMQENYRYMAYLDKHIRAAGGAKSEAVMLEVMQNA